MHWSFWTATTCVFWSAIQRSTRVPSTNEDSTAESKLIWADRMVDPFWVHISKWSLSMFFWIYASATTRLYIPNFNFNGGVFFCFGFETYLFNFGSLFDFNIGFFYLEYTKKRFLFYHTPYTRTTCVFSIPFLSLFPLFFHTFTVCTFWEKKIHTVSYAFVHLSYRRRNEKKNQNEIQTRYFTIILTAIWRSIDVVNCCSNDLSNLLFFFFIFLFSFFTNVICVRIVRLQNITLHAQKKLRQIYDSFHFLFSHFFFSKTIKCVYFSI